MAVLSDGKPKTSKEIVTSTGLSKPAVWSAIRSCWEKGLVLRSEKPIYENRKKFRGRLGYRKNTRGFYYYVIDTRGAESIQIGGNKFVSYDDEYVDARGSKKTSKAQLILNFLRENIDRAFFFEGGLRGPEG